MTISLRRYKERGRKVMTEGGCAVVLAATSGICRWNSDFTALKSI